ncbi:MAG: tetratricopeptide repeat protein, partial [Flavobacteriales bacterium]
PEAEALQQIVREFPYFGAAQTLLSRAYLNAQDHRLTDQVSHAAFYTGNRMGLYQLIHPVFSESEPVVEKSLSIPEVKPETTEVEIHTDSAQPELNALATRVLEDELTPSHAAPSMATEAIHEEAVAAPTTTEVPSDVEEESHEAEEKQEIKEHPSSPLQEQILIGAIADSIALEVQPERQVENQEAHVTPRTDFSAWLKQRSRATGFIDHETRSEPASTDENPDDADDQSRAFYQSSTARGQHRMLQAEDGEDKQRKLIDRFIQYEPKIERGRAPEYPQANMAKESLEEDPELVTETMAQLFARQGKFDKARKAYRKLMEQFPEKSVYFAAQLKSIEKFKK